MANCDANCNCGRSCPKHGENDPAKKVLGWVVATVAFVLGMTMWVQEINEANQIQQENQEWIDSRFGEGS